MKLSPSIVSVFAATALLSVVAGCKSKPSSPDGPQVYVVNAIPGTSQLRMSLSGQKILTGPGFDGAIRAYDTAPGEYTAAISAVKYTGAEVPLPVQTVRIQPGHRYALVVGLSKQVQRSVYDVSDKPTKPNSALVTVVNAAPDSGAIDLSLNAIVSFASVPFAAVPSALTVPAGTYQIAALASGETYKPLTDTVEKSFKAGKSYTIFVTGSASEHGISLQTVEN